VYTPLSSSESNIFRKRLFEGVTFFNRHLYRHIFHPAFIRELVSLIQAENPDRALINRKIEELDRLESEMDAMMAASEDIR
jgi:hypothetical protein